MEIHSSTWLDLSWSDWLSLNPEEGDISSASTSPGLYRVRHRSRDGLEYIGQTGRSLRGRLRALSGCYKDEMPFTDPHVAAPCLWAIRHEYGPELEFSFAAPAEAQDKQDRLAIEEALIAVYRRDFGESPTANFGRMIDGYEQSSLRQHGVRGGKLDTTETTEKTLSGVSPLSWNNPKDPLSESWMGLDWSDPVTLDRVKDVTPREHGLYRIWDADNCPPLEYIGQSANLYSRLNKHRLNRDLDLLFSYVTLSSEYQFQFRRREHETELLGAHWLVYERAPRDQF